MKFPMYQVILTEPFACLSQIKYFGNKFWKSEKWGLRIEVKLSDPT